jgi:hypothetical protein
MTYRRRENVVARAVAGENVLIPVGGCTESLYTLNAAGCRIWDWLAEPRTADELATSLAAHYGITQETASRDVRAFLADVTRMDLVTATEP